MNPVFKNRVPSIVYTLMVGTTVLFLNGCARNISSNSYSDSHVGEASETFKGRIISVRTVNVGSEQLGDNATGTLLGGVGGGVIGGQFGKGHGRALTTLGGAAIGALAGAYGEQELKNQNAYEYVVELRNGEMRTVVQGMDTKLLPGQPVLLMISHRGRSRLIPHDSGF